MGQKRNLCKIFVGKAEEKTLRRTRFRWKDAVKRFKKK
jgi:hypothetical protein